MVRAEGKEGIDIVYSYMQYGLSFLDGRHPERRRGGGRAGGHFAGKIPYVIGSKNARTPALLDVSKSLWPESSVLFPA